MHLSQEQILQFQKLIKDFYRENKRDMPWRETTDPYGILISEVMLQQTQVPRVREKYTGWIKELPTFEALAAAPLSQVLKLWSGLGYNRRALFLQKTAQKVVKEYNGKLPKDPKVLERFPGIGKNTAGALCAYAWNIPVIFIETNIRRTFIHHFFSKDNKNSMYSRHPGIDQDHTTLGSIPMVFDSGADVRSPLAKTSVEQDRLTQENEKIQDSEILPLVEQTLDRKNPREWYYALMDYGTFLAKSVPNPNRKSKHYTKQSPLKGSLREARGRILKVLSQTPAILQTELEKQVDVEPERFQKALTALVNERFIKIADGIVEISPSLA